MARPTNAPCSHSSNRDDPFRFRFSLVLGDADADTDFYLRMREIVHLQTGQVSSSD